MEYRSLDETVDELIFSLQSNAYLSAVRLGGCDYLLAANGKKAIPLNEQYAGYYDLDNSDDHLQRYISLYRETIRAATMPVAAGVL